MAHPLFQAEGGGSTPTSALQLVLDVIDFDAALSLNRAWHSRLPRFGTGAIKGDPNNKRYVCHGAIYDGLIHAVSIWSLPGARLLPQDGSWFELRRLAIGPDAPRNTGSRMLRIMELLIRRSRPEVCRLISYQDTEVHTGGIYRAAGWTMVNCDASNTQWDMPGRPRPKSQSDSPKVRWEKVIYERADSVDRVDPAGAEADLPLSRQPVRDVRERDADRSPSLW